VALLVLALIVVAVGALLLRRASRPAFRPDREGPVELLGVTSVLLGGGLSGRAAADLTGSQWLEGFSTVVLALALLFVGACAIAVRAFARRRTVLSRIGRHFGRPPS
jgi:cell division protein FtsX